MLLPWRLLKGYSESDLEDLFREVEHVSDEMGFVGARELGNHAEERGVMRG